MLTVASNVVQNLYTISLVNNTNGTAGVPQYSSGGHTANVVLGNIVTAASGNVRFDAGNSVINLGNATSYLVSAAVTFSQGTVQNPINPAQFYLVNANTGAVINNQTSTVGTPFTTTITNSTAGNIYIQLQVAQSGTRKQFEYPSQLAASSVTVIQAQ